MKQIITALALLIAVGATGAQEPPDDTQAPEIPKEKLARLVKLVELPKGRMTAKELLEIYEGRLQDAMSLAVRLEREHPEAPNLYRVRELMMQIAQAQAEAFKDPDARKVRLAIARRLVDSGSAPVEARYHADVILLDAKVPSLSRTDLRVALLQFVGRYISTGQEIPAKLYALMLAGRNGADELYKNLRDDLTANHLGKTDVRAVLRAMGEHPDVGKVFTAELTDLDGKKIRLPQDTRGKVVVLNFWGTWVPKAEQYARKLRNVQSRYKNQGLVVIGISLDKQSDKDKLLKFIQQYNLDWVHTFSGKSASDPVALKTGLFGEKMTVINPIPNRWVIGRDGKVISDAAMSTPDSPDRLEKLIKDALALQYKPEEVPARQKPKEQEKAP